MAQYKILTEVVIHGNRWLAGDVITMSEEDMAELQAKAAAETPPVVISVELIPEPVATGPTYKPTMKPIDLPSGMTPADIPYTPPPAPLAASKNKTAAPPPHKAASR